MTDIKVPFLPLERITASYGNALADNLLCTVRSGWYLNGERLALFERDFARWTGTAHCIGVGNGLDALTLALMAMKAEQGWGDDAEVVVPAMTFVATAQAVARAGLVPVAADVDERALLTAQAAEQVLTSRTRVLLPVHLYGQMAPMDELSDLARQRGLMVLEDAAQAHGAALRGRKAGAWGHMAAFSFYPGKNLGALGDAGAVTTGSEALAQRVRMLANYGADRKYHHVALGMNSRMDEVQAAVLATKLPRLEADNEARRRVADFYASHLANPLVRKPLPPVQREAHVYHIYAVRCDERDRLQQHLAQQGIQTLMHYPFMLPEQPALAPWMGTENASRFPHAADWARCELSLPIHPCMSEEECRLVVEAVNDFA